MLATHVKVRHPVNVEYWGEYELCSITTVKELVEKINAAYQTHLPNNIFWLNNKLLEADKLISYYQIKPNEEIIIRDATVFKPLRVNVLIKNVDYLFMIDAHYTILDLKKMLQKSNPEPFGTEPAKLPLYEVGPRAYNDWMEDKCKWTVQVPDSWLVRGLADWGDKVFGAKRVSE